ncbi:helix-turn-helix domain-containing protein [Celeribacter litoreus]|uniref:helix-turn-helix domain-containing protein n=1 Tax=Celeribacter litoreus TaxID=2876714 RepID=UPI001CCCAE89|nr:helix-turn-helix domain-containing protein [Celeribacter litoreus]MCA0044834.1 helix-turn-helix domain-containing protein [Celeribacter litoreus]
MQQTTKYTNQPVEAFVSDLRSVCGYFDVRPAENQREMQGGARLEHRAGLELGRMAMDVQQVIRTSQSVKQDTGENYFLILQEEGKALMSQNDVSVMMTPGDMVLIDSAAPSEFTFFGQFNRQLSLHLPRAELHSRFGYDLLRGGLSMPRHDPMNIALYGVLAKVMGTEDAAGATNHYLREAIMGLLGAMLHERSGREDFAGIEADLGHSHALTAGQAYIDTHYRNPDLSVQDIADDLCMSSRQLQRGFASAGTTPTKYLMMKRLEHTRRGLDDRRAGRRDDLIASIAYEAGFSDLSYFNRCFRKAFGQTPKDYLRVIG